MVCRIAEKNIEIVHQYDYVEKLCGKYQCQVEKTDFTVTVSDVDIDVEEALADGEYSRGYLESLAVYRKIALQMVAYGKFLFHAAVLAVDGEGYAFAAPSGTGKTTHIQLWKEIFGERVEIINGDKPIFEIADGKLFAHGTPWAGKEGWNINQKVPLSGICFLQRGLENKIERIDKKEYVNRIFQQVYLPKSQIELMKTLDYVDEIVRSTRGWLLTCNMQEQAAILSYEMMSGKRYDN